MMMNMMMMMMMMMRARQDGTSIPPDFDVTWFAYFINFYPDIGDYIHSYKKLKVGFTSLESESVNSLEHQ